MRYPGGAGEPEDLTGWLRAGIRRTDAVEWRRWKFGLEEATAWIGAGITAGLTAAQWRAAGVTPAAVGKWRAAGIASTEAVHWHEMGFTLEQAKQHKANGHTPDSAFQQGQTMHRFQVARPVGPVASVISGAMGSMAVHQDIRRFFSAGIRGEVAHSYIQAQWLTDDALVWAKAGITAGDARLWAMLGVTPAEAAALAKDQTPVRVIQDWWQAGIPLDEVADWLGAGLTAAEAVAQRANGITVDQAAALRALRRADPGN